MPAAEPRLPIPIVSGPVPVHRVGMLIPLAGAGCAIMLAAAMLTGQPAVGVAVPAAALGAIACSRWPAPAVVVIFLLTATTNVLPSTTPIPNRLFADFLLVGLWLGVAVTYAAGNAERRFWLWPPLILPIFYLVVTAIEAMLVTPLSAGLAAFRASAWYLAAALLVAMAPWSRDVHRKIARGIAFVALIVGGYCLYRFLGGPGAAEEAAAILAKPGLHEAPAFFGSFLSANELATWASTMIPLLLVLTLAWRGRWRLLPAVAIPLLALALFESDVRTGIVAVAVGVFVVIALYLVSPAFPGRLAAGLAGLAIAIAIGAAGYGITVGTSSERADRFSGIFEPGEDPSYTDRERTWSQALADMSENPWGHGLGTSPDTSVVNPNERAAGAVVFLDSSYLKVGLEQGFFVMVLYIGGFVILLLALAIRATRTRDRQSAALIIGACGALAPALILFYAGAYSVGLPITAAWLVVGLGISQVTIHRVGAPGVVRGE
jgi:O-Antigen ligase